MSAASSGVARGIIPGSLKLVRSKVAMTKRKMRPSATGIAGDTPTARYGQLKAYNGVLQIQKSKQFTVQNTVLMTIFQISLR